ncbi:MAG: hypothetical protein V4543_18400 [Bacteroidota bacterium]
MAHIYSDFSNHARKPGYLKKHALLLVTLGLFTLIIAGQLIFG